MFDTGVMLLGEIRCLSHPGISGLRNTWTCFLLCSDVLLWLAAHSLPQPSLSEQGKIYAGHKQVALCGFSKSAYTRNTGRITKGKHS